MHAEMRKLATEGTEILFGVSMGLMFSILWTNRETAATVGSVIGIAAGVFRVALWFSKRRDGKPGN
jgi:hypothetical protein